MAHSDRKLTEILGGLQKINPDAYINLAVFVALQRLDKRVEQKTLHGFPREPSGSFGCVIVGERADWGCRVRYWKESKKVEVALQVRRTGRHEMEEVEVKIFPAHVDIVDNLLDVLREAAELPSKENNPFPAGTVAAY